MCKWLVKCEVITQHLELIYTFSQSLYLGINFTHLIHFFHTVTKVSCPKLALGISNWPSGKKKKCPGLVSLLKPLTVYSGSLILSSPSPGPQATAFLCFLWP